MADFGPIPQVGPDYQAPSFNYLAPEDNRQQLPSFKQWIEVFRNSIPTFVKTALQDPSWKDPHARQAAAEAFAKQYEQKLRFLEEVHSDGNTQLPPPNTIVLTSLREACLLSQGFVDPFKHIKDKENKTALKLLPTVLSGIDQVTDQHERLELLIRGVFAGNKFDLGAAGSAKAYEDAGVDFEQTRQMLQHRPWAIDNLNDLVEDWTCQSPRKTIMFVDNSGSDVVLGMLPLARELLRMGSVVVLAANASPSINDITAAELAVLVKDVARLDDVINKAVESRALSVVSTGTGLPVLDLSKVASTCRRAAANADLIILEGMGRALETNLYAQLSCNSLKLGMIKHPEVAQCLSAKLYDCVCKYDRGADQGRQNPCHWSQCQGAADWLHLGQRRTQVAHSIRLRAAGNAWWIRGTSGMSDFDSDE